MKHNILLLIIASFVIAGCATTQNSAQITDSSQIEATARDYQVNGRYEEAIEAYRQLIDANPKHIKSVLYQHEILRITERLSDPRRMIDEVKTTLELFDRAQKESFEGATPEAIQQEQEALDEFIFQTGAAYHMVYQNTRNKAFLLFAKDIYELYTKYIPVNENVCLAMYYYSDMCVATGDYYVASNSYKRVLDECEKKFSNRDSSNYMDAAHSYVIVTHQLSHSDSCPKPDRESEAEDVNTQELQEHPIPECHQMFIDASKRYLDIYHKESHDTSSDFVINIQYQSGLTYFNYNHFDKAIPLFLKVIEEGPLTENAVFSCGGILNFYRLTKNYKEMLNFIREIKNNQLFMLNTTFHMKELVDILNDYEAALNEKFAEETAN